MIIVSVYPAALRTTILLMCLNQNSDGRFRVVKLCELKVVSIYRFRRYWGGGALPGDLNILVIYNILLMIDIL